MLNPAHIRVAVEGWRGYDVSPQRHPPVAGARSGGTRAGLRRRAERWGRPGASPVARARWVISLTYDRIEVKLCRSSRRQFYGTMSRGCGKRCNRLA